MAECPPQNGGQSKVWPCCTLYRPRFFFLFLPDYFIIYSQTDRCTPHRHNCRKARERMSPCKPRSINSFPSEDSFGRDPSPLKQVFVCVPVQAYRRRKVKLEAAETRRTQIHIAFSASLLQAPFSPLPSYPSLRRPVAPHFESSDQ